METDPQTLLTQLLRRDDRISYDDALRGATTCQALMNQCPADLREQWKPTLSFFLSIMDARSIGRYSLVAKTIREAEGL